MGCIGKTFISARTPKHEVKPKSSNNKQDGISITLQAICDSKLRFLDVYTSVPSKNPDTNTGDFSYFIPQALPLLCSTDYHILGDSTYPLREYLMTPYPDNGHLTDAEKHYNLLIDRTYHVIKTAFAVLKNRFRQLKRLVFHKRTTMAQFIVTCCVLHNICIDQQDFYDEEIPVSLDIDANSEALTRPSSDDMLPLVAQLKRNQLKDILYKTTITTTAATKLLNKNNIET